MKRVLNSKQIGEIIVRGEGPSVEFKRELSEDVFQGLNTDIASFANSWGGTIIVGVNNSREVVGTKDPPGSIARVHHEATTCIPPVAVNAYEIEYNRNKLIVIEIPRGDYIYCDKKRKFPYRIGARTDFMETQIFLSLAKSRNLIPSESESTTQQVWTPPAKKAPNKDDKELILMLSNSHTSVRLAAVQDLRFRIGKTHVENLPGFWGGLVKLLGDESVDVRRNTLTVLDALVSRWAPESSPVGIPSRAILEAVPRLAKDDPDISVRQAAFQVLCWVGMPEFMETVVRLLVDTPKDQFQYLNAQYNLSHLPKTGVWRGIRKSLYSELEKTDKVDTQNRILDVLMTIRSLW